jgi:Tfp pilus assembly protein PilF
MDPSLLIIGIISGAKGMAAGTRSNGFQSVEQALDIGVEAVEQGDLTRGEAALSWVLKKDPANQVAWFWLACCAPDDDARQECYRRASEFAQVT